MTVNPNVRSSMRQVVNHESREVPFDDYFASFSRSRMAFRDSTEPPACLASHIRQTDKESCDTSVLKRNLRYRSRRLACRILSVNVKPPVRLSSKGFHDRKAT
jgi:hypothetical protein